jgi:hypothetical protein
MREFLPQLDWDEVDMHRPIAVEEILAWADAHYARHGTWPTAQSGKILGTRHTWVAINQSLQGGSHGLSGRTSLAKFLHEHRRVPIGRWPPNLSEQQILTWADAHFAVRGKWPAAASGPIPGTGETWAGVNFSLRAGGRGLCGGLTLTQLLAQRRGIRNHCRLPPLKVRQILEWAKAHHKLTGGWPACKSGPIVQSPGDTWQRVNTALDEGQRGLPGGSSLAQLLARRLGVRNPKRLPPLDEQQILTWAKAHFQATGRLPNSRSGPIARSPGETWNIVDNALMRGTRGLPGGSSLAKLLRKYGLK